MEKSNTAAIAMAAAPRNITCHYNPTMVVAAFAVSLLGAFTSTQLMSQARGARTLPGVFIWTILGCLTFGFCGVWCLHFLAMLSCKFDVPIGLKPLLTVLSAVVAVSFTFFALSTDLVAKYRRRPSKTRVEHKGVSFFSTGVGHGVRRDLDFRQSSEPLLRPSFELPQSRSRDVATSNAAREPSQSTEACRFLDEASDVDTLLAETGTAHFGSQRVAASRTDQDASHNMTIPFLDEEHGYETPSNSTNSTTMGESRYSIDNNTAGSDNSRKNSFHDPNSTPPNNMLLLTAYTLWNGLTLANVARGFVWSMALTTMHFVGMRALAIRQGYVTFSPAGVILCGLVSWSVCCVGVILMADIEINIKRQLLFSVVAATGIAAVHFSGMYACSFWSTEAPTSGVDYPSELPVVIGSVAVLTCMASTGLLAHSATKARDKLAEVLYTRRKLWAAIAQKENAEAAAAARGQFIASASHEIRTPLHQLQGYADLLAKSELSEEDRQLLHAIQLATRSLSMITSNVLDWSRLESGEATCRPITVDIRQACEAVVHVLPKTSENTETELIVVVAPEVPLTVSIDETYLQRILMNLLSNSVKFTASGYVMLLLQFKDGALLVTVLDTGSGIPKSFLPQLFEPYKQVQARGAERGTGLGLSITKRLLAQMRGSIVVDSKYQQDKGVGVANSGSRFALTIPIATSEYPPDPLAFGLPKPLRVAIMHTGKHRDLEGLAAAWTSYGAEVSHTQVTAGFPSDPCTIVWADLSFLRKHPNICTDLLRQQQNMVLIPYQDRTLLEETLGSAHSSNVIPIRKPLIWHRIIQTLLDYRQAGNTPDPNGSITATLINDHAPSSADESRKQTPMARKRMVLLVEDNKINQKLGAKMLTTLKHDVLLAEDGQEAIDIIMEHGQNIDAILMDQSMPKKDGLAATREIRELEAAGRLGKRHIIIAVTAAAGPEAQAHFLEAGTDMFLTKPLSLAKLEQALEHYFNG